MRTYFEAPDLHITDEWVQAGAARYPVDEIRRVWTDRPAAVRGHRVARWALVIGGGCLLVGATLWPLIGSWVTAHLWIVTVGLPLVAALLFWQVGLDVLAHRKENRPYHLWIDTPDGETTVLTDNEVEVNKALRALTRARSAPRSA